MKKLSLSFFMAALLLGVAPLDAAVSKARAIKCAIPRLHRRFKCNAEERAAGKKWLIRTSVATVIVALGALGISAARVRRKKNRALKKLEKNIGFDREKISQTSSGLIEGYWATASDPTKDLFEGRYPFPQKNTSSWPGEEKFLEKLFFIEQQAGNGRIKVREWKVPQNPKNRFYTQFHSRFNEYDKLGLREFFDVYSNIGWTGDLGSYYIKKFHVKPSRDFYRYVMGFSE